MHNETSQASKNIETPSSTSPRGLPKGLLWTSWVFLLLLVAWLTSAALDTRKVPYALPLLWPEDQRSFLQDGPGLLLSDLEIEDLLAGETPSLGNSSSSSSWTMTLCRKRRKTS